MSEDKTFVIENAQIIWRNFRGEEGPFNKKGVRNFSVVLDLETAEQMLNDGWNVKYREPREPEDELMAHLPIAVRFDIRPPRIVIMPGPEGPRTQLNEDTVETLDWVDIKTADLFCRGHYWEVNGKSGTKAYLQSLFVTINEDPLERKYRINEKPPSK